MKNFSSLSEVYCTGSDEDLSMPKVQTLQTWNFFLFYFLGASFCLAWSGPKWIRLNPDPKSWPLVTTWNQPILTWRNACSDHLKVHAEPIATLSPFAPIEGHRWFFQVSSQWESRKNRFAFICFSKIQFLPSLHLRSPVHTIPPLERSERTGSWDRGANGWVAGISCWPAGGGWARASRPSCRGKLSNSYVQCRVTFFIGFIQREISPPPTPHFPPLR